jgi:putative oxidoreductase
MRKFLENNQNGFYFAFRVIVGLMFLLHGWMKLSSIMAGTMPAMSLMGLAALIEVVGGIFIIIGFLTRWTAVIAGIEMIVAFFMAHASKGLNPLANGGEAAVLFLAAFLVLAAFGARKWSVDKN